MSDSEAQNFIHLIPTSNAKIDLRDYVLPSQNERDWFPKPFYHCLPLVVANSIGWTVHNIYEFSVLWDGTDEKEGVTIEAEEQNWAISWFGYGTFTIQPRFLVRTSNAVNLLIRSTPNYYKLGIYPMEGLVETDWLEASFTLNFKITHPNERINFNIGEPLVNLFPCPRFYIENFSAKVIAEGSEYNEFMKRHSNWIDKRSNTIKNFSGEREFDYMRGKDVNGNKFDAHQKAVKAPKFE